MRLPEADEKELDKLGEFGKVKCARTVLVYLVSHFAQFFLRQSHAALFHSCAYLHVDYNVNVGRKIKQFAA